LTRRTIGRVTLDERPDSLIVASAFFSRPRAISVGGATVVICGWLGARAFDGPATHRLSHAGILVVLAIAGYCGMLLALNRTVTTLSRERVVVRRGPIPVWPAATFDAAHIEDVHATVATGIAGRGGRVALDAIVASLVGGRTATLIDDAGNATDAQEVAAAITTWLWSRR
jgi:hypothetical protein